MGEIGKLMNMANLVSASQSVGRSVVGRRSSVGRKVLSTEVKAFDIVKDDLGTQPQPRTHTHTHCHSYRTSIPQLIHMYTRDVCVCVFVRSFVQRCVPGCMSRH